jgi:hypothetical protein
MFMLPNEERHKNEYCIQCNLSMILQTKVSSAGYKTALPSVQLKQYMIVFLTL